MTYKQKLYELHIEFLDKFKLYSDEAIRMTAKISTGLPNIIADDGTRAALFDDFQRSFTAHRKLQMYIIENKIDEDLPYENPDH